MKILGFYFIKGATAYEAQIGRVWIRLLKRDFWIKRAWPWFSARLTDKNGNAK